jgi:erythromycin esterase
VVAVGESWHPVHEFLSIQHRITRFLIERLGFTVVLMEASLAGSRRLDDFVNGSGSLGGVPFSAVWNNVETRSFLTWLRDHNAGLPPARRVRIIGIDIHVLIMENLGAPATTPSQVFEYLHQVDPGYVPTHLDTVERIFAGVPTDPEQKMATFWYFGTVDAESRNQLRTIFTEIVDRLTTRRADYLEQGSAEDFEWALHRAQVLLQAQTMYELNASEFSAGIAARVEAMAENVRWALDHTAGKAVLLATGVHVAKAPWAYAGDEAELPSLGMRLAGPDYLAITTTFGHGAFDPPNPITGTAEIPLGDPDSLDLALAETGAEYLLLDLREAPPGWISQPHPLRPMQNVAAPPQYRLSEAFDVVVHVDEIRGPDS